MKSVGEVKAEIDRLLDQYSVRVFAAQPPQLLPPAITTGKLYEAWVLCEVLDRLHRDERFNIILRESRRLTLKSSPGPINRSFPHFTGSRRGGPDIEIWTDVEFLTLSHHRRTAGLGRPVDGDYHELDILVVPAGAEGRPPHDAVLIGVECKNTGYQKNFLRAALGIRRELSLLSSAEPTIFASWPRRLVPADPPSCLLVYAVDPNVVNYQPVGDVFGINFTHAPLP